MKIKEMYIDPELEMINYSFEDIVHTSVIEIPGIYKEGEIGVDTDMFEGENIDIGGGDDFFDDED